MSASFLTEEWFAMALAEAASLPVVDGVDAQLTLEIADAPPEGKKMRATASIENGQLTSFEIGKNAAKQCVVVAPAEMAAAILQGADAEVAYMRGDVKLNDAYELVLFNLRPMLATPEWSNFISAVVSKTDF